MNLFKKTLPPLAGSLVLNLVHELARNRVEKAPEINKIGEEAIANVYKKVGEKPPTEKKRYAMAMAGDLIANTAYYRMVAGKSKTETWTKGLLFGLVAGVGALTATAPLGLDDTPVNRSTRTKAMTVLYYTLGGLATAAIYLALNKHRERR
ncbi:hypothetical protein JHJ32_06915 [Parapedobacter sp. ISTM3]|uniref:Uncharacterized protein n=1 Tax=Parapedobacter luteus TaxID=623280 RepID=A0A1T5CIQ5_9SPHI|nr:MULTISPECIES: hypothetical protein [Parapedobacter]MBK1439707.1 hypothetical protein [Parapedobacter sp. ISTM3]SKB59211.1 hypothetical protein SAMN05660226_02257 [Parapedobacter luteus]